MNNNFLYTMHNSSNGENTKGTYSQSVGRVVIDDITKTETAKLNEKWGQ